MPVDRVDDAQDLIAVYLNKVFFFFLKLNKKMISFTQYSTQQLWKEREKKKERDFIPDKIKRRKPFVQK